MDKAFIIRPAVEADLAQVLHLYSDLTGVYQVEDHVEPTGQPPGADLLRVFHDDRQHILVAEWQGKVVGTLTVVIVPNIGHHGTPWAALTNVVVDKAFRGRGIGTALMGEAGRIGCEHHCYKIILSSNLAREQAHLFYQRLGWEESHIGFSLPLNK